MAFAAETMITVPSGAVQISELRAADRILATGRDPEWQQYEVKLAESLAGPSSAIRATLEGGRHIVVTLDQLFLAPGGALRRAHELQPGDLVIGGGRQPVRVRSAVIVQHQGEIYDVATSAEGEFDGHLIEADGLIVADFDLQQRYGA